MRDLPVRDLLVRDLPVRDLLVIGAGVAGLSAAHAALQAGRNVAVIEARGRVGGRVLSPAAPGGRDAARYDLGPAWFWPGQERIAALLDSLALQAFPQHAAGDALFQPATGAPQRLGPAQSGPAAFRIAGGAAALTDALAGALRPDRILLETRAARLERVGGGWRVHALGAQGAAKSPDKSPGKIPAKIPLALEARRILIAAPPRIVAETFGADLPPQARAALRAIPTWMAAHAKIIAVYPEPFWRRAGLSGDAFSHRGPLAQIHDASPADAASGALFGFVGVPAAARAEIGPRALKAAAAAQLAALFGPEAGAPNQLLLKDWSEDPFTATAEDRRQPGGGAYGPQPALDTLAAEGLAIAAAELDGPNGGLLEGALTSAARALAQLETGEVA